MTSDEFLPLLEGTRRMPRGWLAKCPSHDDRSPSLSVREGDRGLLVKCWVGCSAENIMRALGLRLSDLFFDCAEPDSKERQYAMQQRDRERREREHAQRERNDLADAQRKADRLIASAKNVSIDHWTPEFLNLTLDRLADAYALIGDCYGE